MLATFDRLGVEPDLAAGHPGHLLQVVDQLAELAQLVVDHIARPTEVGVVGAVVFHDPHGVADRGQGIAQLVTQHGQELVPASLGFGELAHPGLAAPEVGLQSLTAHDHNRVGLRDRLGRGLVGSGFRRVGNRRGPPTRLSQAQHGRPASNRRQNRRRREAIRRRRNHELSELQETANDQDDSQHPDRAARGKCRVGVPSMDQRPGGHPGQDQTGQAEHQVGRRLSRVRYRHPDAAQPRRPGVDSIEDTDLSVQGSTLHAAPPNDSVPKRRLGPAPMPQGCSR